MDYLIAHDVGTSGDKAALLALDGRVLATDSEPYPTHYPRPLWAEQDPEALWQAVGITTKRLLKTAKVRPAEVLALSFSTQMVNAIFLDGEGRPLRPAINWLDGRAGEQAQQVMRKLGGPGIFAKLVGATITGKDLIPKYLWMKRHEPEVYQKAAAIVDVSGYILWRATGKLVYEWSTASVTGLFNLKSKSWDTMLMRFFGLKAEKFPELVHSCERVGGLAEQAATDLGLRAGTPVIAGAGDAMTAAVGSGAVADGDGHLCLGTSGFVGILTSRRATGKQGIVTLQSADRQKLLLIGETETCGECLRWAARELHSMEAAHPAYVHMDKIVADTAPGSGGLLFTPWMYGERSPISDERARASFINLGANHTRAQMTRAIYEGVAFNLRWILESITTHFKLRPDPIRVIGGGARGLPWLRIIADVSGMTLESVAHPQEASAVGAALIAAVGMGVVPSIEAVKPLVPVVEVVEPDCASRAEYEQLYGAFKCIYPALRKICHALN